MNNVSLIDGHIDNCHRIDLWVESWRGSDVSNMFIYLGAYDAENIYDAVQQWMIAENIERRFVNILRLTYRGRKLYSNEYDGRNLVRGGI